MEDRQNTEMTFWDHLEELRGTLTRSLLAVFLMMIPAFIFKDFLFDVIMAPTRASFPVYRWFPMASDLNIVNLEISGQFMVHMRTAAMMGVIVAFPYIIFELWRFVAPALYPKEKKSVGSAFVLGTMLFYMGVTVGYFILMPVCLSFFQGYSISDSVANSFSLQSYISLVASTVLMIGLVFEFPMLIMVLSSIGVVNRSILKKGRKYALVAVLVVAALITPADPGSMIIAAVPLYALYELSILCCRQ